MESATSRVVTTIDQRHGAAPFIRLAVEGSPELMPTEARELAARLEEQADAADELWQSWDESARREYRRSLRERAANHA